jgi:GDP-D-mannose dehydratase
MPHAEYKSLVKNCRNVEESAKLMADMKAEGKLLSCESKLETDKVTSCFEFCDEKAFREYEARYEVIPGNSSKLKKQLGFSSKREFKQTVIS